MERDALAVVPEAAPVVGRPPRSGGAFRALRVAAFRRYFAGQVVSASGTFVQQTALAWAVLNMTGSASKLGLVLASGGVPYLLFGPLGGRLVDRVDNRRLLLATQACYGLLAVVLWLVASAGRLSVPLIVSLSVAGGFVQIADSPARLAFVGQLVPAPDLASAVSLNGVIMNSSRVIGPAVAGLLIVEVGTTPCFAVNAVSYALVLLALATIHPSVPARSGPARGGVGEALSYVRGHQQLYLPLAMMALVGLVAFNFNVALPLLAKDTYHDGGGTYGLLSVLLSIGSVAGSLAVGMIGHPRRRYLLGSSLAFGACLTLAAAAPNVTTGGIALLLTGFSGYLLVTMASTALQLHADPAYRGRVMALWVFVYLGTTPVGNILAGWLSAAEGPRAVLLAGAVSCLAAAGLAARVHTPPDVDAELPATRAVP
jgi:MFS family permease